MLQNLLETSLRQTMNRMVRPLLHPAVPVSLQRTFTAQAYRSSVPPRGCKFDTVTIGGIKGTRTRHGAATEGVVLYLHGGGYIIGSSSTHRGITGHLAKASGHTIIAPDYRLAPEHPFPAALDDAESAYEGLLKEGHAPASIGIAGDSAGGGLAIALAMRLRDKGRPLPASLTVFSPWVDLTHQHLYSPEREPVLQPRWIEKAAGLYAGKEPRTNPLMSPIHGDLSGLPPLLIQVGSEEILLNDAQRLSEQFNQQGSDATLEIYNSLWHVFHVHAGQLSRATDALAEAAAHINRHRAK
ncbi:alpha/beta hydrolase [Marinobacter lipolyticus SM19]|uniref:Alpha/beta hydrolase n=1 Tax=Marinobacter lipolyticus SM19 TaxID=1318628 RepID=R8B5R7_9GAMM|nr:alpha/beta hydrolase [Marinobacter lipolyticus]EON93854.1 alpha/beta hydrolase [Marinobacter lipolyticus SM19]